jgi:hypothetical protein
MAKMIIRISQTINIKNSIRSIKKPIPAPPLKPKIPETIINIIATIDSHQNTLIDSSPPLILPLQAKNIKASFIRQTDINYRDLG